MHHVDGNVGLAFGLVFAAGACTCLGAALVFCTNLANHRLLSGALGVSAGVMTYISFVEIFSVKAVSAFQEAGFPDNAAARYATLCFFGGALLTWLLDKLVHALMHAAEAFVQWRQRAGRRVEAVGSDARLDCGSACAVAAVTAAAADGKAADRKRGAGWPLSRPGTVVADSCRDMGDLEAATLTGGAMVVGAAAAAAAAPFCSCDRGGGDGGSDSGSGSGGSVCDGCGLARHVAGGCCDDGALEHSHHLKLPPGINPELRAILEVSRVALHGSLFLSCPAFAFAMCFAACLAALCPNQPI